MKVNLIVAEESRLKSSAANTYHKFNRGSEDVTSVLISNAKVNDLRNFRCPNCGVICFQYEGDLVQIRDDGALPEHQGRFDLMCGRCRMKYRVVFN